MGKVQHSPIQYLLETEEQTQWTLVYWVRVKDHSEAITVSQPITHREAASHKPEEPITLEDQGTPTSSTQLGRTSPPGVASAEVL